jgi:hypothetical protein
MNLMKKYSLHFESIVYYSKLLASLIRKDFYSHVMLAVFFFAMKEKDS